MGTSTETLPQLNLGIETLPQFDIPPFPGNITYMAGCMQQCTQQRLEEGKQGRRETFVRPVRLPYLFGESDFGDIAPEHRIVAITKEIDVIFGSMIEAARGNLRVATHTFGLAPITSLSDKDREKALGHHPLNSLLTDGFVLAAEVEILYDTQRIESLRPIHDRDSRRAARDALKAVRTVNRARRVNCYPYWSDFRIGQFLVDRKAANQAKQEEGIPPIVLVDPEPFLGTDAPDNGCATRWTFQNHQMNSDHFANK